MEKFRKQIKTRMIGYIVTAVLLAILYIVLVFIDKTNAWGTVLPASISGAAEEGDFTSGFRTGFCSAIIGFAAVKAVLCAAALWGSYFHPQTRTAACFQSWKRSKSADGLRLPAVQHSCTP